jgi:2-polyprenyl-3-methyl-5-hydroxy-6-metoxy-1,4-benzoquinol methylase
MAAVHERTSARDQTHDLHDLHDLDDLDDQRGRYAIERAKWDAHATTADEAIECPPPGEDFGTYARRQTLLPGVAEFLGDLDGKQVIEYGCGLGQLTVLLARSGARVTAFDISAQSIETTRRRAQLTGVEDMITFAVAAGEELPFDDGSFDIAVGKAVLHHLDPVSGSRELARILRPGGRAAFSEPLGTNPVVRFARDHVPYPGKHERGADIPLRHSDVDAWMAPFSEGHIQGVQLLSMVERGLGFRRRVGLLREYDRLLLARWPGLWPLCRYAVLTLTR